MGLWKASPNPAVLRLAAVRAACSSAPLSIASMAACATPRLTRLSVLTSRFAQTYHSAKRWSWSAEAPSTYPRVGLCGEPPPLRPGPSHLLGEDRQALGGQVAGPQGPARRQHQARAGARHH